MSVTLKMVVTSTLFMQLVKSTPFNLIFFALLSISFICNLCGKQYIGETKHRLKDRFNEHRRPILNPNRSYIHKAVSEHFT